MKNYDLFKKFNFNYTLIIVIILYLLQCAKMAKYAKYQKLCDFVSIVFIIVWLVTRIGLFPFWILYRLLILNKLYMVNSII